MTKFQLLTMLTKPGTAWVTIQGIRGVFQSILREDGSGNSFLLTLSVDGVQRRFHVKTID